uniref:hypothetical protein n=1 Tax=Prevotella sp. TaxID=59823 RepID=UPI004029C7C1
TLKNTLKACSIRVKQGVLGNFNHTGGRIGLHGLSAASSLSHIHAVAYRKMQLCCWRRPLMVRQPYSEAV